MGRGGKGKGKVLESRFQIELGGEYKDYDADEDVILKRAYLVGHPKAKYKIRGQSYQYEFGDQMTQTNLDTKKFRNIRPPWKMTPPKDPLLPPGPMVVLSVPSKKQNSIDINDPNNPGKTITVAIPPGAKPGSKIAVPVPAQGEDISQVVKKQRGWSTGAKVAAGAAAVGALAVGGVVLGEHLTDGAISSWAEPGLDAAGDFVTGAADAAADWAAPAAEAMGDAAGDVGDWAATAGEDAGDWLGEGVGDVGDFITDLF